MKTVDEILKPFIAAPSMATEGHFAVADHNTTNVINRKGVNVDKLMYDIINCNPELRKPGNAAILDEVYERVQIIAAGETANNEYQKTIR